MNKILLFGGSFDPIHNAHLKLTNFAYRYLKVDRCDFVLAKNPRWKSPSTTPNQRLEMLSIALQDYSHFNISLIEYNSNKEVSYTYDTVMEMGSFDTNKYYYLIGSDQLEVLNKWYKIDELSKLVQFVVFIRYGYPINNENLRKYNCILLPNKEFDISSTEIRSLKKLDCPKKVIDYIVENKLYFMKKINQFLSNKRLKHSISVAFLSYDIAKYNKVNPYKAFQAGLLHDIAKEMDLETSKKIMMNKFPQFCKTIGKWAYHQFIGPIIVEKDFDIHDKIILNSIMYHSTGRKRMTKLDKIIYCADKLDPSRDWDSTLLIEKCKKNINDGFIDVIKDNIKFFKQNNITYDNKLTLECFKYYLKEGEY